MLSDTLSLSKDPSVNRLTPKLVKNVERAVALTEGALTFGKAEEPAPQPEYIDLNVLVDEVIENEQKFINGRDIVIEKEITVFKKKPLIQISSIVCWVIWCAMPYRPL